jgi:hypothetical protein
MAMEMGKACWFTRREVLKNWLMDVQNAEILGFWSWGWELNPHIAALQAAA